MSATLPSCELAVWLDRTAAKRDQRKCQHNGFGKHGPDAPAKAGVISSNVSGAQVDSDPDERYSIAARMIDTPVEPLYIYVSRR